MADKATGRVKWFDHARGYGFIEPDDGMAEVFLHFNALNEAGIGSILPDQRVRYMPVPNPTDSSRLRAYLLEIVATPRSEEKLGTVKWYNPVKGYGFIEPKDGSLDVFMHVKIFGGNEHVPKALVGQNVCYTDRPNRENSKLSFATSVRAI
jgi:cold shock protein